MEYSVPELNGLIRILELEAKGRTFDRNEAIALIDTLERIFPAIGGSLTVIRDRIHSKSAPIRQKRSEFLPKTDLGLGYSIFPW